MNLGPTEIPFLGKLTDDICLSGGAKGADVTWGYNAHKAGHQVVHWSFEGHKSYDSERTFILTEEELLEADDYLREANLTLKRRLDFNKSYINLLRRNWYQVKYADSVYAVGSLNDKAVIYDPNKGHDQKYHLLNDRKDHMGINGGTAWAVQCYHDRYRRELSEMSFFLWFYDQNKEKSFVFSVRLGCWVPITVQDTPAPSGIYAAIGSRALNAKGNEVIIELF